VNYHLRTLEVHGLVELAEERRKGNMTERIMRATAAAYVIAPSVLSAVAPDPDRSPNSLSSQWLIALCSRAVGEVGELLRRSQRAQQDLATFGLDVKIAFSSAVDRASFVAELSDAIEGVVARYHDASSPQSRTHRLIVGLHPKMTEPGLPNASDAMSHVNT
jgi:DNA-binding transcriptional ArsR family regulator